MTLHVLDRECPDTSVCRRLPWAHPLPGEAPTITSLHRPPQAMLTPCTSRVGGVHPSSHAPSQGTGMEVILRGACREHGTSLGLTPRPSHWLYVSVGWLHLSTGWLRSLGQAPCLGLAPHLYRLALVSADWLHISAGWLCVSVGWLHVSRVGSMSLGWLCVHCITSHAHCSAQVPR